MVNKYLLDTHIFIQWMEKNPSLNNKISDYISNPDNTVYLSLVSIWEITIKKKLKKLHPPKSWKKDIKNTKFNLLSVSLEHVFKLDTLPLLHKDPFDRMLVAQAKEENLHIITADKKIWEYKVKILKA